VIAAQEQRLETAVEKTGHGAFNPASVIRVLPKVKIAFIPQRLG
jgi:hypothetical protein